jgi:hypothetical protein
MLVVGYFCVCVTPYQVMEWNNTPSHPMGANRHPCDRICVEGDPPMTCKYQFVVEVYSSLGRVRRIPNDIFSRRQTFIQTVFFLKNEFSLDTSGKLENNSFTEKQLEKVVQNDACNLKLTKFKLKLKTHCQSIFQS